MLPYYQGRGAVECEPVYVITQRRWSLVSGEFSISIDRRIPLGFRSGECCLEQGR